MEDAQFVNQVKVLRIYIAKYSIASLTLKITNYSLAMPHDILQQKGSCFVGHVSNYIRILDSHSEACPIYEILGYY